MSNFKKNIWAYGVIGAFILFATIMVSFAVYASGRRVDLVVTDYYKQELEFQKQLDKEHNANRLDHKPSFLYDSVSSCIKVLFPDKSVLDRLEGKLSFMRPNDPNRDHFISLKLDGNGEQIIPLTASERGQWMVSLEWSVSTQAYLVNNKMFFK